MDILFDNKLVATVKSVKRLPLVCKSPEMGLEVDSEDDEELRDDKEGNVD